MQPGNRTAFTNKSVETRTKKKMVPSNNHQTDLSIWPVGQSAFGVAIKLDGKPMQSKLVADKAEVIKFLEKVL